MFSSALITQQKHATNTHPAWQNDAIFNIIYSTKAFECKSSTRAQDYNLNWYEAGYVVAAIASSIAGAAAWIAKILWSKEFKEAKDAQIAAKEAEIQAVRAHLVILQELTPMKLREYHSAIQATLSERIAILENERDSLHEKVKQTDEQVRIQAENLALRLLFVKRLQDDVASLYKKEKQASLLSRLGTAHIPTKQYSDMELMLAGAPLAGYNVQVGPRRITLKQADSKLDPIVAKIAYSIAGFPDMDPVFDKDGRYLGRMRGPRFIPGKYIDFRVADEELEDPSSKIEEEGNIGKP